MAEGAPGVCCAVAPNWEYSLLEPSAPVLGQTGPTAPRVAPHYKVMCSPGFLAFDCVWHETLIGETEAQSSPRSSAGAVPR